jgi:hypothetical protein
MVAVVVIVVVVVLCSLAAKEGMGWGVVSQTLSAA